MVVWTPPGPIKTICEILHSLWLSVGRPTQFVPRCEEHMHVCTVVKSVSKVLAHFYQCQQCRASSARAFETGFRYNYAGINNLVAKRINLGCAIHPNRAHIEYKLQPETICICFPSLYYTEAKVDVTQEIEQRAQQAAQAGADHCALYSISCVTSTLASVKRVVLVVWKIEVFCVLFELFLFLLRV